MKVLPVLSLALASLAGCDSDPEHPSPYQQDKYFTITANGKVFISKGKPYAQSNGFLDFYDLKSRDPVTVSGDVIIERYRGDVESYKGEVSPKRNLDHRPQQMEKGS